MMKTEDIATLSDEQLGKTMRQRQSDLRKLRDLTRARKISTGTDKQIKFAEEDVCYLMREQEIRVGRAMAHRKWVATRRVYHA
jgi:hypothetical protein